MSAPTGRTIFIGSSEESKADAEFLAETLEACGAIAKPWYDVGMFPPGTYTLARLLQIASEVDAAILVFGPDDRVWYRRDSTLQPRDNVLLEYGLFACGVGIANAILARAGEAKVPTDLAGLTYLHLPARHRVRRDVARWLRDLDRPQKSSPEVARLRREVSAIEQQLDFERAKARDLESLILSGGGVDLRALDLATDGHWKLLFDYEYFWEAVKTLHGRFATPEAFRRVLRRFPEVVTQIQWSQLANRSRTKIFIAKTLRLCRRSGSPAIYTDLLGELQAEDRAHLTTVARQRMTEFESPTPVDTDA